MRILLVHDFYGSQVPSGENMVFDAEKKLLEQQGHTVEVFIRENDRIYSQGVWGAIKAGASIPWNPFAASALMNLVHEFKPEVVHAHNTFPLISPSIFHAIGHCAARVLTLHNYRLLCSAAIPVRDGTVCTDCIKRRSAWPALRYGCYRSSHLATLPLVLNVALHRKIGTWRNQVDAFIALSEFQKSLMIEGGLPAQKIYVKPNFFAGSPAVVPTEQRGSYAVFVGRLGIEKGVHTLIEAWRLWGSEAPELYIVGDGPLGEKLRQQANGLPVRFFGQVEKSLAQKIIANASLLVLPSEWYETFGLVISEAFALGTPVAVSNLGPLPTLVNDGVSGILFEPADPASILNALKPIMRNPFVLDRLSKGARLAFEVSYSELENYQMLMGIYERAVEYSRSLSL